MNRLSRVFLIPLTTLVCTKILILSLFYEQYPHQFQRSSNNNKKEAGNLRDNRPLIVSEMRFELTRANAHYPLKVACRTGLEPACLSTHAPETCASTNSATWAYTTERYRWSEKRDSNPRPQPWQGCALPTELFSPFKISIYSSGTLSKSRAKNGTRTRDPNLGKLVLYQLSYFRNCECKDSFTFRFMQMVY